MKNLFLFLSAVLLATPVFAMNRVEQLSAMNPHGTDYEILKQAFDESSDTIRFSDIDSKKQSCAYAAANAPAAPTHLSVGISSKIVVPATPGHPPMGPLLPGEPPTPAVTEERHALILVSPDSLNGYRYYLDNSFDAILEEVYATQIRTYIDKTSVFTDAPFEVIARKSGALVTFSARSRIGAANEKLIYGYCWQ